MIHIVVEGPGPRKNAGGKPTIGRSRKTGKPTRIPMKRDAKWRARLYNALHDSTGPTFEAYARGIRTGIWKIRIDVYENEQRHLHDVSVPLGDWDSCGSPICDALQPTFRRRKGCEPIVLKRGLLDDDARILEGTVRKHYDKARPRVEITLTEIVDG